MTNWRAIRLPFYSLLAFACLVLTHLPLLDLPCYWDELGQFVPAALDIFQRGLWVPRSTIPNIHPPGLMAYLAAVWSVFGYSIAATRLAMLALGAATLVATFRLSLVLCGRNRGVAALASALLLASPLFYTQAMLAQLDLPAALLTLLALLLFLEDRFRAAALVSVALALTKETGLVVPVLLGAWLFIEGKRRLVWWYALPAAALAGWLVVLWRGSGNVMGNSAFTEFNLFYPLHPVRLATSLLRRAVYLCLENFHWIGWIAIVIAWKRTSLFRTRAWALTAAVGVAQTLAVTALGGATLERYLMPVLPLMFIAMAATLRSRIAAAALVAGMLVSFVWTPVLPHPWENNLAMIDFVRLQADAAGFVESRYPGRRVATAWPLTGALRKPELGYVQRRIPVRDVASFSPAGMTRLQPGSFGALVLYSREQEPRGDPRRLPVLRGLAERYYAYADPITPEEAARLFGLKRVARFERRGQWAEVLAP
jgi:4-amino-4-deoxy-L-arabinose transferase-like glycosyltransferase